MIAPSTTATEQQARAYFSQGNYTAAETLFMRLATDAPQDAVAQYNLGVCVSKLERFEDALACYRRAIELNPAFADAYTNFGVCLNALNLIPQARQAFALARKLMPDDPIPMLNEGIAALALGDYEAGWKDFSARWQLPAYAKFKRAFDQPVWNGENLSGKTLFLYQEQGFGDTIQMARYIPILVERGAAIIVESPPALTELLRSVPGGATIITKGDPIPDFDYYCAMMDIPGTIGTTIYTIPDMMPYLGADTAQIENYQKLLSTSTRKKIGICWAGRESHENDHNRSLKFAQLAPLLCLPNIEWISLQRHVTEKDAKALAASKVLDWGRGFTDFSATAAAIMALDLVITVDTSIAHLAGALGKETWVLLPFYADWRWLTACDDSPWYPTARLFRQQKRGNWADVLSRVSQEIS